MEDSGAQVRAQEHNFWTCKFGMYAGGCRCRIRGGDNECYLEKEDGVCGLYEKEDEL